jgi:hypothetical protein
MNPRSIENKTELEEEYLAWTACLQFSRFWDDIENVIQKRMDHVKAFEPVSRKNCGK